MRHSDFLSIVDCMGFYYLPIIYCHEFLIDLSELSFCMKLFLSRYLGIMRAATRNLSFEVIFDTRPA